MTLKIETRTIDLPWIAADEPNMPRRSFDTMAQATAEIRRLRALDDPMWRNARYRVISTSRQGQFAWLTRHNDHRDRPADPLERGLCATLDGLREIASAHVSRYESSIGDDYVLGEAWSDMWRGLRAMLNGEIGQLDGGEMDRELCELWESAGFDPSEI